MEPNFTAYTPQVLFLLANEACLSIEGPDKRMPRQGRQNKEKDCGCSSLLNSLIQ